MTTRNTILNKIKDELKTNIKVTNGYSFTPVVVRRGVYSYSDLKNKVPALCFTFIQEAPYEDGKYPTTYDDIDTKAMSLMFYGFANTNDGMSSDKIFEMVEDVENFLTSSNFTYNEDLKIDNIEVKEGGPNDLILTFLMEVRIIVNNDVIQ